MTENANANGGVGPYGFTTQTAQARGLQGLKEEAAAWWKETKPECIHNGFVDAWNDYIETTARLVLENALNKPDPRKMTTSEKVDYVEGMAQKVIKTCTKEYSTMTKEPELKTIALDKLNHAQGKGAELCEKAVQLQADIEGTQAIITEAIKGDAVGDKDYTLADKKAHQKKLSGLQAEREQTKEALTHIDRLLVDIQKEVAQEEADFYAQGVACLAEQGDQAYKDFIKAWNNAFDASVALTKTFKEYEETRKAFSKSFACAHDCQEHSPVIAEFYKQIPHFPCSMKKLKDFLSIAQRAKGPDCSDIIMFGKGIDDPDKFRNV